MNNMPQSNVAIHSDGNNTAQDVVLSPRQLQQLLTLIPGTSQDSFEALDSPFSGMITCNKVSVEAAGWIMDTGATDHMTSNLKLLTNVKAAEANLTVRLPTGDKDIVSHTGDVHLKNGLKLLRVLYVPLFTHNLVSIQKLSIDNGCHDVFNPTNCVLMDTKTNKAIRGGKLTGGLYNLSTDVLYARESILKPTCPTTGKQSLSHQYVLWHNRLGHAPSSKLKYIECIKHCVTDCDKVCVTCPMAKFMKLPYNLSESGHHSHLNYSMSTFGGLTNCALGRNIRTFSQLWMTTHV